MIASSQSLRFLSRCLSDLFILPLCLAQNRCSMNSDWIWIIERTFNRKSNWKKVREVYLKMKPRSALDSLPTTVVFPGHSRSLGEQPEHQSPPIQIGSIKHSPDPWDGWIGSQVLMVEERFPTSRHSQPPIMALPWKLSRRRPCHGHEDWAGLFFLDLSEVSSDWGGSLDIMHGWGCSEDLGRKKGFCPSQDA